MDKNTQAPVAELILLMDEEDLFDEFGNYIGPVQESSAGPIFPDAYGAPEESHEDVRGRFAMVTVEEERVGQVVLHEDKQYYPSAEEVYGRGVEVLVQEEDTQHLSQPIIAPVAERRFEYGQDVIRPVYDHEYMLSLLHAESRVRRVMVAGALHSGKTSLIDLLFLESHQGLPLPKDDKETLRWMDSLFLERDRSVSLRAKVATLLLPDSKGTSRVLQVIDTPGHPDFFDEAATLCPACDTIMLVVDVAEGCTLMTEQLIRLSVLDGKRIVLVLNKVERLVMELRLPPSDAYFKLRHCIEEVNTVLRTAKSPLVLSPERGNVIFASTLSGWAFSLDSFARLMVAGGGYGRFDASKLAARLWGDIYYDPASRKFSRTPGTGPIASKRTFVSWILEPLYKTLTQLVSEDATGLDEGLLAILGIRLTKKEHQLNSRSLLAVLFQKFLGSASTVLVDSLSTDRADSVDHGDQLTTVVGALKAYPDATATSLDVLVHVREGVVRLGQTLHIPSPQTAPEEWPSVTVTGLAIPVGRYSIPVDSVPRGCLALVSGIEAHFTKAALFTSGSTTSSHIMDQRTQDMSRLKVSLEPVNPSDLPRMLEGLRRLTKVYPALQTRVEESGEHVLLGPGELYLDTSLHSLRTLHALVDIKLGDPTAILCETVLETSFMKCHADTPNAQNRLGMIAEPMEKGLAEAVESGLISPTTESSTALLRSQFGWDLLATRSIWALGPDPVRGPNILLNDTLPDEVDQQLLLSLRPAIIQGFQWAVREGPLTESPIRGVKFRLVDAIMASEPIHRAPGQIIPTTRRLCYSAILTATPRLMEPVSMVEIVCPKDVTEVVYQLLAKRRGHVLAETPKAGTPLVALRALLPVLDSFGFETDLRTNTLGSALPQSIPAHWQVVPGDPLDTSLKLVSLEPAPAPLLARDLFLKTRRRKGLAPEISHARFFDEAMLEEMAREQAISGISSLSL